MVEEFLNMQDGEEVSKVNHITKNKADLFEESERKRQLESKAKEMKEKEADYSSSSSSPTSSLEGQNALEKDG